MFGNCFQPFNENDRMYVEYILLVNEESNQSTENIINNSKTIFDVNTMNTL